MLDQLFFIFATTKLQSKKVLCYTHFNDLIKNVFSNVLHGVRLNVCRFPCKKHEFIL
eukprot:TRINITY_DN5888_c0_g1_i1.p1 TRINITY_DN5888_c0_g1~~TRINITY_DN5888_c0_g1_i1.p1  ORF type:complete len:57 (+),score=6.25 TRINITY_DN5888_c0_g1_i1:129-299(+)